MKNKIKDTLPEDSTPESSIITEEKGGDGENKGFTQEEVNRIISERLEREKQKFEEKLKKEIANAQAEAERLAKLSEEEKLKQITEKQRKEIEKRERLVRIKENRLEGIEKLNESGIPIKFVDFVIDEDRDKMEEKINTLKSEWEKAISQEVAQKLKGKTLKDPNIPQDTSPSVITQF